MKKEIIFEIYWFYINSESWIYEIIWKIQKQKHLGTDLSLVINKYDYYDNKWDILTPLKFKTNLKSTSITGNTLLIGKT